MTKSSGIFLPANLIAVWLMLATAWQVLAVDPIVSNVQAKQREGSRLVDITYDVADPDSPTLTVYLNLVAGHLISNPQPMTNSLPLYLSRILRIAFCLIGAMAAILMAPPVVAEQRALPTDGAITCNLFANIGEGF